MNKKYILLSLGTVIMMISAKNWWESLKAAQAKGTELAVKEVEKRGETVEDLGTELDAWMLPNDQLRFDQVAYLGSHNSHVNAQGGFVYSQQKWGLDTQLQNGVRHFLIDMWAAKDKFNEGVLLLCHEDCQKVSRALRGGMGEHAALKLYFEKIKKFLDAHPKEIVSLELENYASPETTLKVIQSVPGVTRYLLTPADYDPLKHDGKWPTLNELITMGKRLIIFDTGASSQYAFNTNDYMIRNMYGKLNVDEACQIRNKPAGSRLFQMNYFGTVSSPLPNYNTPQQLKELLKKCQQKKVVSSDKTPNFLVLDNVHLGNAMEWINDLNAQARKQLR